MRRWLNSPWRARIPRKLLRLHAQDFGAHLPREQRRADNADSQHQVVQRLAQNRHHAPQPAESWESSS
jgi:hypothetical protein